MKKLILLLGIIGLSSYAHAIERMPSFRVWRSSALQGGNYNNVQFSSESVIFHMITGSPTVNNAGNSYFIVAKTTADTFGGVFVSTKLILPLDASLGASVGLDTAIDILSSSHTWINKQGTAQIFILWDYLNAPPNYTTGGDSQSKDWNP